MRHHNRPIFWGYTHAEYALDMRNNETKRKQAKIMNMKKGYAFRLAANCALPAISEKNWSV